MFIFKNIKILVVGVNLRDGVEQRNDYLIEFQKFLRINVYAKIMSGCTVFP